MWVPSGCVYLLREQDQLQYEAALQELRKELQELNIEREALKQAQELNVLAVPEKERL